MQGSGGWYRLDCGGWYRLDCGGWYRLDCGGWYRLDCGGLVQAGNVVVAGTGWDGADVRGVTQRLIAVFTDPTHTFSIR